MSIIDFAITRNAGRPAASRRGVSVSEFVSYFAFVVSVGFAAALVFGIIP